MYCLLHNISYRIIEKILDIFQICYEIVIEMFAIGSQFVGKDSQYVRDVSRVNKYYSIHTLCNLLYCDIHISFVYTRIVIWQRIMTILECRFLIYGSIYLMNLHLGDLIENTFD